MDFATLILFLALYYVRPQEWFDQFNALHPVQLLSLVAFVVMISKGKFKPGVMLRTPLDWLVLCYFGWTLFCGFQPLQTIAGIQAAMLFYFVAATTLDSVRRQKQFLGWWCFFMLLVAFLAVASMYGFDPLNSLEKTESVMKGRLMLNLTVFDNPNGLGHSIVPAVPLIYYLFYWRRTAMKTGLLLMALPLYCLFLTQSKGAYLSGFVTVLATLTFSRSKPMQIAILVVALGIGYGALYQLPRMNELNRAQTDPAIQGRVAAFKFGLNTMRTHFFGIGLGNFEKNFLHDGPLEKVEIRRSTNHGDHYILISRHYSKASHSAYNQNGAELGYIGLILFVGILYCCVRTLLLVKSKDDDEERIRRALFAMVIAYATSSWMVDFCYRPTFFMMVAAISAFHRHLLRKQAGAGDPLPEKPALPARPWMRIPPIKLPGMPLPGLSAPLPAGTGTCLPSVITPPPAASTASATPPVPAPLAGFLPARAGGRRRALAWHKPDASLAETLRKNFIWTRLGTLDLIITLALTYGVILYWQHLIKTM